MLTLAIPNKNGSRFLEDTLFSIGRNRPYVRWWLQDSCSADDSVAIANRFATPEDRIVVEKDQGQADALNRAFKNMGGDVVGFLNSDDCLADGAAEAVLLEFDKDPSLDLLYGEVDWIDPAGGVTGHHTGGISTLSDVLDIYGVWWNQRQWVQPEVFWRRRLWEKTGPFNTRYDLAFDYEFWVRCFQAGAKVKRIPRTLAQFRLHPAQKSKNAEAAAGEIRNIVRDALATRPSIGFRNNRKLRSQLSYDRYQSGQDWPDEGVRPSFSRMLLQEPSWTFLPTVRERIYRSIQRAFSERAQCG